GGPWCSGWLDGYGPPMWWWPTGVGGGSAGPGVVVRAPLGVGGGSLPGVVAPWCWHGSTLVVALAGGGLGSGTLAYSVVVVRILTFGVWPLGRWSGVGMVSDLLVPG
ncbi:Hypothetical predicted protein, partial [Prunus dulcis]